MVTSMSTQSNPPVVTSGQLLLDKFTRLQSNKAVPSMTVIYLISMQTSQSYPTRTIFWNYFMEEWTANCPNYHSVLALKFTLLYKIGNSFMNRYSIIGLDSSEHVLVIPWPPKFGLTQVLTRIYKFCLIMPCSLHFQAAYFYIIFFSRQFHSFCHHLGKTSAALIPG